MKTPTVCANIGFGLPLVEAGQARDMSRIPPVAAGYTDDAINMAERGVVAFIRAFEN